MSQQTVILPKSLIAGEDMSDEQYHGVYLSGDNTVSLCTTSHLNAIGILANKPSAAGQEALVHMLGTTKAVAGEGISAGARVWVDTDARIMTEDTAAQTEQYLIGIAMETAVNDGDIIEIFLMAFSFVKGAT